MTEQRVFEEMTKAIEEKELKELEYLLAKRNADRLVDNYKAVVGAQAAAQKEERHHCVNCGRQITDYEDTEFNGDELIFTYKCPDCGFYGEQHFNVIYSRTEEII